MGVVLTRPVHEAERWAVQLRERGFGAIVLPLLAIGPAPDPVALRRAAKDADTYRALMFVSANAVRAFFAAAPPDDAPQFDSEHLWPVVQGQVRAGDRVLVVRGGDGEGRSQGRDWLLQQLAARGVAVDTVAAYTRAAPSWSDDQRACAQRAA